MIDYSKVKVGDVLKITGQGAPGFAKLGDLVTVKQILPAGVRVRRSDGLDADFVLSCGAERLELVSQEEPK